MPPTNLENLWAASSIAGLSTNVTVLLTSFIVVGLIFTAARYIRKSGVK